jgi:hypothetical protein
LTAHQGGDFGFNLQTARGVRQHLAPEHVSPAIKEKFVPGDGAVGSNSGTFAKVGSVFARPRFNAIGQPVVQNSRLRRIEVAHRSEFWRGWASSVQGGTILVMPLRRHMRCRGDSGFSVNPAQPRTVARRLVCHRETLHDHFRSLSRRNAIETSPDSAVECHLRAEWVADKESWLRMVEAWNSDAGHRTAT